VSRYHLVTFFAFLYATFGVEVLDRKTVIIAPKEIKKKSATKPITKKYRFYFGRGKTKLSQKQIRKIKKIRIPDQSRVVVAGYSDSRGNKRYNKRLSHRRALRVMRALRKRNRRAKYVVKAYGETKPRYSNRSKRGRAKNRRVEVRFQVSSS